MAAPATGPYPEMTLTTPGGNPASLMSSHILKAERGVCSAVLRTRVHPQARAGAISEENERDGERRDRIQRVLLKSEVLSFPNHLNSTTNTHSKRTSRLGSSMG